MCCYGRLSLPPHMAKLALLHPWDLGQSCLNKIRAAHHWPSSVWIGRISLCPSMCYIKPKITPPSPLDFAILNGGSKRRIILADLVSPRGKPAENTRHLSPQAGVGRLGWGLVWLIFSPVLTILLCSLKLHDIWVMLLMWNIHYNPFYLFHVANLPWHS